MEIKYVDGFTIIDGIKTTIPEDTYRELRKKSIEGAKSVKVGNYVRKHLNEFPGIMAKV